MRGRVALLATVIVLGLVALSYVWSPEFGGTPPLDMVAHPAGSSGQELGSYDHFGRITTAREAQEQNEVFFTHVLGFLTATPARTTCRSCSPGRSARVAAPSPPAARWTPGWTWFRAASCPWGCG